MARILVVDDEAQMRAALKSVLARHEHDVLLADSVQGGFEESVAGLPDLVVLDLGLPDGDGIELVSRIRSWSSVPILVLSADTDPRRVVTALQLGADDFLGKPFGVEELVARIGSLLRRAERAVIPAAVRHRFDFGAVLVDVAERRLMVHGEEVHATPTEWRLLDHLLASPGSLLTYRYLTSQVWGETYGDEARGTLRAHVRTLRAKLDDPATEPVFIETVPGAGYRWIARVAETGDERDAATALHDLGNVLTSVRLGLYVLRRQNERPDSDTTIAAIDSSTRRAADLLVELRELVGQPAPAPGADA